MSQAGTWQTPDDGERISDVQSSLTSKRTEDPVYHTRLTIGIGVRVTRDSARRTVIDAQRMIPSLKQSCG
jgi:hypothetical protein